MQIKMGGGIEIDLERLLATRMFFRGDSGAGKSHALRRLLEQCSGKVQQLIIDREGEFVTLREIGDYVIVATKDGDAVASVKTAALLARRLREAGASAVLDISGLNLSDRRKFVKLFLESLMLVDRDAWAPCLVVLDEADFFCPQAGDSEAADAVKELCNRGRKQGLCAILATQRLSRIHKDAVAGLGNKMIGRTVMDVDLARSGDELGFSKADANKLLPKLEDGHFYAHGSAFGKELYCFHVGDTKTRAPQPGKPLSRSQPSINLQKLLAGLTDLPKQAEEEAKTNIQLRQEVTKLRKELGAALKQAPVAAPAAPAKPVKVPVPFIPKEFIKKFRQLKAAFEGMPVSIEQINSIVVAQERDLQAFFDGENKRPVLGPIPARAVTLQPGFIAPAVSAMGRPVAPAPAAPYQGEQPLSKGALDVLRVLAARFPASYTRGQAAKVAGRSTDSSIWMPTLKELSSQALIVDDGGSLWATEQGVALVGADIPPPPMNHQEAMNVWKGRLRAGEYRMLTCIVDATARGEALTRDAIAVGANVSLTSSMFSPQLKELIELKLVEETGGTYQATQELWPEAR